MFMLRYRDPLRYGKWLDGCQFRQHPDGPAVQLSKAGQRVESDAYADDAGEPRQAHPLYSFPSVLTEEQFEEANQRRWTEIRREAATNRCPGETGDVA